MLLKLLKHEIKTNRAVYIILFIATVILSLLFRLTTTGVIHQDNPFSVVVSFLYVFAVLATIIYVFVMIIISFNNSMFRRSGYLTLTLPVSVEKIILVKMIMAAFWMFASISVVLLSSLILIPDITKVFSAISKYFSTYGLNFMNILFLFLIVVQSFYIILLVYLCVTFVHTKYIKRFRGLIGTVLVIGISYVIQFIGVQFLTNLILPTMPTTVFISSGDEVIYYSNDLNQWMNDTIPISIVICIVFSIIFFIGIIYLIKNKIELD